METAAVLFEKERSDDKMVTHINVGGIRYLPLAPAEELRSAVREYLEMRLGPPAEMLDHLLSRRSVELCRDDWEGVLRAAYGAASDPRLSPASRDTFSRVRDVLDRAIPVIPTGSLSVS